jgi:protein-L-isoaspartate O-methyltransferase
VERIKSLIKDSLNNISKLRNYLKQASPQNFKKLSKINFLNENIFEKGKIWKKRYDKIIFTAGIRSREQEQEIKKTAKDLLKRKGILVCPKTLGSIIVFKKQDNGNIVKEKTQEEYSFVPLLKGKED